MAASAWEVLRRLGRPAEASELASALSADPTTIQESLDALSDAGVIDKLPIRSPRKHPTYRANGDYLAVAYEPGDRSEAEAVRRIATTLRGQVEAVLPREEARGGGPVLGSWQTAHLEPEERAELQRLLQDVIDFLEAAQARMVKADGAAAWAVNVHVLLEVRDAAPGTPPLPAVRFIPRTQAEGFARSSVAGAMARLSPREREVAMLLANGRSRPEIASKLGVSGNTVATISKRIYAKLGVRRRVDLSNRIRRGSA
jgi:DNA-binding CsgD family transcriptional regulator/DNA-binding transcriptional ArsR family regulator